MSNVDGSTTPAAGTPAAGTPAAGTPPAATWYTGVEAELVGHWQNKGLDLTDPAKVAVEMTKQHRAAERHFGVPADQLLKIPKADAPEADHKAFYQRLGAPADPKDYDFSAVKLNGQPLDDAFQGAMRAALAAAYVPKDKAPTVTQGVVKFLEDADRAAATERTAKIEVEKAELAKSWGNNAEYNRMKAIDGVRRLGFTPEIIDALESVVGYAKVMEGMRRVGMAGSEAAFVDGGNKTAGAPVTVEGAAAELANLKADPVFRERLIKGDPAASRQMHRLIAQVEGETPLY